MNNYYLLLYNVLISYKLLSLFLTGFRILVILMQVLSTTFILYSYTGGPNHNLNCTKFDLCHRWPIVEMVVLYECLTIAFVY